MFFALHVGTISIPFGVFTKDGRFIHEFKTTRESVKVQYSQSILYRSFFLLPNRSFFHFRRILVGNYLTYQQIVYKKVISMTNTLLPSSGKKRNCFFESLLSCFDSNMDTVFFNTCFSLSTLEP